MFTEDVPAFQESPEVARAERVLTNLFEVRERQTTMNSVLMIAFHFPPCQGSSGIHRTLRFVQHLPDFGWQPIVLTASPRAFEHRSDDLLNEIPISLEVVRAAAWDAARHFSVLRRYPAVLARPDRWISWWPAAVRRGLSLVQQCRPRAVWSTYPIATAHKIAHTIARKTGLPWIADFRDPMAQPGYPTDPATWKQFSIIERRTVELARYNVFTTPAAAALYRDRYASCSSKVVLIENGYDEETFSAARPWPRLHDGKLTLLHSGIVYPSERDPTHLFLALKDLKRIAPAQFARLVIRFRAAQHEQLLHDLAQRHGVTSAIEVMPPVKYSDALSEMLGADGLLLLQARNCNEQVPAKLYEYLRAGRPIIALTDPVGDTAVTLQRAGIDSIAPLDDRLAIRSMLLSFVESPDALPLPAQEHVRAQSRRQRTLELAQLLGTLH